MILVQRTTQVDECRCDMRLDLIDFDPETMRDAIIGKAVEAVHREDVAGRCRHARERRLQALRTRRLNTPALPVESIAAMLRQYAIRARIRRAGGRMLLSPQRRFTRVEWRVA